ncbi:MAG TPA: N-acetylmuramoyl-L-alanine amidase [Vicinamibacterales bacterium]
MGRRLIAIGLLLAACWWPATAGAQVRVRYERAAAQAESLRLDGPRPSPLSHMRRAMNACEAVANRYPSSGYADNALWHAARVALGAYHVYRSEVDLESGIRYLERLISQYPSSSLKSKAEAMLRKARKQAPSRTPAPRSRRAAARAASAKARSSSAARVEAAALTTDSEANAARSTGGSRGTNTLRAVTRSVIGDVTRVILEFDGEVRYQRDEIGNPRRVYFDFEGTQPTGELQDAALAYEDAAARLIRLGRPRRNVTRLVIELDERDSYSVFALYNPYRLAIDVRRPGSASLAAESRMPAAAPAPSPVAPKPVAASLRTQPEPRLQPRPLPHPLAYRPTSTPPAPAASRVAEAMKPKPLDAKPLRLRYATAAIRAPQASFSAARVEALVAADEAKRRSAPLPARERTPVAVTAPMAPSENRAGGFSIARQLGLGVSRIVIDPGHGGKDPGTLTGKTSEAEVVLDIALRLEKLLLDEPGFDVVLTRRTDVFVPLEERTAIANRHDADLFLSIHANSSRNRDATGVETYVLDFAKDAEAEAVAARENATAARSMHQLPDMIRTIALNNKLDESRDFARLVQETMVSRLKPHNSLLRDRGVKQAPFVVLIGASMPSVLAEIAFISNRQEGRLLSTPQYRQRIAEALFQAVKRYRQTLKAVGTVATQ